MSPKEEIQQECESNNITMTEGGEQITRLQNDTSKDDNNERDSQPTNTATSSVKDRKSSLSSIFLISNLNASKEKETSDGERNADTDTSDDTAVASCPRRMYRFFLQVYLQYEFLILIIIAICLALAYPPLGAEYLQPQITSSWIAVIFIFCK
jgi:hypothetical protein